MQLLSLAQLSDLSRPHCLGVSLRRLSQPERFKIAVISASSSIALSVVVHVHHWYPADVQRVLQLAWTGDCFCLRAGVGRFPHSLDSAIVSFGSGFDTVNYNVIIMMQRTKAVSCISYSGLF